MTTNELIDSIRNVLDGRAISVAAEVLALDYARHCREVNERLGKIALMLEGGGEIQALQHAEQAPRVVDTALALSFGGEAAWQDYCRNHGHEVAPLVDARTVEALLAIQEKGLASNHPLYKDYRAAVSSRDDERAHSLIRIIARMNPGDENAAKELKRLRRKELQGALSALRDNLDSSDEFLLAAMTQVEEAGIAEDYEQLPEWQQALAVRNRVRRTAARARMPEALGLAEAELQGGSWRQAAVLHGEYTVLEASFGLGPEQGGLDQRARAIEVELANHRAEAERLAQVKQLVVEMERIAEDVETRAVTPLGLSPDFANPLVEDLARKLRQFEGLRGEMANSPRVRIESARAQLTQALERCHRAKRLKLVGSLVAASVILLGAAGAGALAYRAKDQADLLASLRGQPTASGVRSLVEQIQKHEPLLLKFPSLAAELAQSSRWLESMDARLALVNSELQALEGTRRDKFAEVPSPELFAKLAEAGSLVASLPPDLAAESVSRLTLLRNDGERVMAQRQEDNDRSARELTTRWAALLATIKLRGPAADAGRTLAPAGKELAPFLKLAALGKPILRLPASTETLITDVDSRVRSMLVRVETSANALAALAAAETTAAYHDAITQLAGGSFSEGAAAQAIMDAWPDDERLKAFLVFRGDLVALKASSNDTLGSAPIPESAGARDREVISELVASESLNNLWVVEWKNSRGELRLCLSQGKLTGDATQGWTGKLATYPRFASEPLKWEKTLISPAEGNVVTSHKPTATSALMDRLKLARLLDDTGTKFRASILPLLDWVANDADTKPLAKAYLWGRLRRLIQYHQPQEWGLHYCPSLIDEIKAFEILENKSPLSESSWLVTTAPASARIWEDYFTKRGQRSSFDELRKTHDAAAAILSGAVELAGHVAADGTIILTPAKSKRLLLGVCETADAAHALQVCGIADPGDSKFTPNPKAAPLSPLFYINLPEDTQTFISSIHHHSQAEPPTPPQR